MYRWDGRIGDIQLSKDNIVIIAGPCLLENLDIALKTAKFLKELCRTLEVPYIFKSSFDKANRTSKNSPRGLGEEKGFENLKIIKKELNVPIITDVHTPLQVEKFSTICDILQIPAFLSREYKLLYAVSKSKIPIHLKKGQHMSFNDIMESINFIENNGNKKIILCERGSVFGYNNLVVDFKNFYYAKKNNIPITFDATHSAQLPGLGQKGSSGNREVVENLSYSAIASGVNSLFFEVHSDPQNALSDKEVQLDFQLAKKIITNCVEIKKYFHSIESKF